MENDFSALVKAAYKEPAVSDDFERRVMAAVSRGAAGRFGRTARFRVAASLSGLAVGLAACLAAIVVWFPAQNLADTLTKDILTKIYYLESRIIS